MESKQVIRITPNKSFTHYWQELWDYRDLFFILAWRDFKVRYKQTVIGVAWAFLRPLLTMIIFTIVFGRIAKLPSDGVPYPLLVFSAMLPWYFFSTNVQDSSNSLISNSTMISKVYFPRIILPIATMFVNLVDFMISFAILIVLMIYFQFLPDFRILALPLLLILTAITSIGVGLWISALNVSYRDFRFIIPFIVQLGLYISPVGFSSNVVPEQWRFLYSMNPMVGVIDGFRWAILGQGTDLYIPGFLVSILVAVCLFLGGIWFFEKTERKFADII